MLPFNLDAYLNRLLGNPKASLQKYTLVLPDNKSETFFERYNNLLLVEGNSEKLPIKQEYSYSISEINEKELFAHLNNNDEKFNCAVFIGNGVSISFSSDI